MLKESYTLTIPEKIPVLGVVLAGGLAKRMDGLNKGLVLYKNRYLASYAVDALSCCEQTIINANKDKSLYENEFDLDVVSDVEINSIPDYSGPLAGMLAALYYARKTNIEWVLTCPCDAPNINSSYVYTMWKNYLQHENQKKLQKELQEEHQTNPSLIYVAKDDYRQPVFALIHCSVSENLKDFLASSNRKVMDFFFEIGFDDVNFSDSSMFININNIEDLC